MRADDLVVLLIKRAHAPFEGAWALPGGFVDANESLERAAQRELLEETGLSGIRFEQLGAYGDPGRDPRGHTVSVAYVTFVPAESVTLRAGDDAAEVAWHPLASLALKAPTVTAKRTGTAPKRARKTVLAFDHARILLDAKTRVQELMDDPRVPTRFTLVPENFTLSQLQRVYEVVWGRPLDKRNFRAKLVAHGLVEPVGRVQAGRHRPAQLFRWKSR